VNTELPMNDNPTMAALSDLLILDLSRVLAGPYCTMLLGDYGAEVIKVEEPGSGDGTRGWGPPWVGDQSAYFLAANRNKRSITVNLKSPEGLTIVRRLAERADVLIENFKPGTMARMGLDYASLAGLNPRLVFCSLTGYGQTGPYRDRPGYDFIIQAQGGIMSVTGPVEGEPYKVGVAIADITTGLFAANAILAALHERARSGQGQLIDVALLDAQIAWLANVAQNYLATGEVPQRYGNAHASIVPYQPFATADGEIAVAIGNDEQYRRFCEAVDRPDLLAGELASNAGRVGHREALVARLQALFVTRTSGEWLDLFGRIGAPAGAIRSVAEALDHEQTAARHMVRSIDHPELGQTRVVGPVAHFSRTPAEVRLPPPLLGQQSAEVLADWLAMPTDEIEGLRGAGVIA
jgi:crotonobetainyl-CoA:carnitine CoA-transferase CaiB-like acyl-CoA transferase